MHRRLLLGAITAAALLAFSAPVASAGNTPIHDTWSADNVVTDTGLCGFPITIHSQVTGDFMALFDEAGSWIRSVEQDVEQDTFSANGTTLVGLPYRFNGITALDADGNLTTMFMSGGIQRLPLPDGSMFWSAGRYDFLAHDFAGTVTPDSGHSGNVEALCAALS